MLSTPKERFWTHVNKTDTCWNWMGGRGGGRSRNYGMFNVYGRTITAHKYSWFLATGRRPDELLILHKCNNPLCVRPDHLYEGTVKDNMRDYLEAKRGY